MTLPLGVYHESIIALTILVARTVVSSPYRCPHRRDLYQRPAHSIESMEVRLIRFFRSILGRNLSKVPEQASPSNQKNLERSALSLISFDISSCLGESFLNMEPAKPHLNWGFLTLVPFLSRLVSNLDPPFETSSSSSNDQPSLGSCRLLITAVSITARLTFFAAALNLR